MARRGSAVHVATTSRHYKGKTYQTHLLRRTFREDGKVKHQTLGNLSHLPAHVIELLRRALRGESLVPAETIFEIERSLPHGHVAAVLGTLRAVGLDRLLSSRPCRERELCAAMIVSRLLEPRSKLATSRGLDEPTSTLSDCLGLVSADEDELYGALDWLVARQDKIETALAGRHLQDGTVVLYDVSSTYFEGRTCPLARHGYSRDGKPDLLQIVFGLLADAEGRPVAVEVFEGDTGDPKTVASQVDKLRQRFGLSRLILVGDRGMLTEARLREDVRVHQGLAWITALRAPAIRKLVATGSLQLSLFDQQDLAEITDAEFPGERLIVCKNPLLAAERSRKREDLLVATEAALEKVAQATRRLRNPLRGEAAIALRVGQVLQRFKMAKHFRLAITHDRLLYPRNTDSIAQEAALDGLYVLRTSVPTEEMATPDVVLTYKSLSQVERAFRSFKTVDLKVRPIHHRLADRVRAHVLLCMLAYYVEWHLRKRLAPLLFDDEEPATTRHQRRASPVAPALRSPAAERKALTKTTTDGFPVHSFQGLLTALATLTKNRVRPKIAEAPAFDQYSQPTPLQQRAFDLLGFSFAM